MDIKRKLALVSAIVLCCASLCSCASSEDQKVIGQLNQVKAMDEEAAVKDVGLSVNDKEAAVYAHVSNNTLLDLSKLQKVDSNDVGAINEALGNIDEILNGEVKTLNLDSTDVAFTNYLLMLFEQTPYTWEKVSTEVRGMDATSRCIVVDLTYATTDSEKKVLPVDKLPLGVSNYDEKAKYRQEQWEDILELKYGSNYSNVMSNGEVDKNSEEYKQYLKRLEEFKKIYGNPNDIISAQKNITLTERRKSLKNQWTYKGLVDSEVNATSGTMTVRCVLAPNYTLGLNMGYTCKYMYMLDYSVANASSLMNAGEVSKDEVEGITSSVEAALNSYYTSLDENNYTGVYNRVSNMSEVDRYYQDYFNTTYRKHDNFTFTINSVEGTKITCTAEVSEKERARGSNISSPVYKSTYYYVLELVDDKLKIQDEMLLDRKLEGEPKINTSDVVTTGFNSTINLDASNKNAIEDAIGKLGVLQITGDTTSSKFSDVVDTSITTSEMSSIKANLKEYKGSKKAIWVVSYIQGHDNYASVNCREQIQTGKNTKELTVIYDLIKKVKSDGNSQWLITGMRVETSVVLKGSSYSAEGSLCECTKDGVSEMNYTSVNEPSVSSGTDSASESSSSSVADNTSDTDSSLVDDSTSATDSASSAE